MIADGHHPVSSSMMNTQMPANCVGDCGRGNESVRKSLSGLGFDGRLTPSTRRPGVRKSRQNSVTSPKHFSHNPPSKPVTSLNTYTNVRKVMAGQSISFTSINHPFFNLVWNGKRFMVHIVAGDTDFAVWRPLSGGEYPLHGIFFLDVHDLSEDSGIVGQFYAIRLGLAEPVEL